MTEQAPPIRSRTRIPASPTPTAASNTTPGPIAVNSPTIVQPGSTDWMKSGAVAREATQSELARNQERERQRAAGIFMPYRLWLPVGKQVEIVVLDTELGPCFYEHNLQNPRTGKYDIFEGCPKEYEHCPLCDGVAGGKESYYVMTLTVVVLDPYINKNGVTVPHSRKLYAVKTNDQPFWQRQFDQAGSLRGRQYLMVRDTQNTPNTGRPEFLQAHSEDAIVATFGHPEIKDNTGRVVKQANTDCYPFPYGQLFHRPSGDDLRRRYGGAAPIGSPSANAQMQSAPAIQPLGGQPTGEAVDGVDDSEIPF